MELKKPHTFPWGKTFFKTIHVRMHNYSIDVLTNGITFVLSHARIIRRVSKV